MKVLFFGTPEFAVPTLNALIASKHTVVGVVTQPDRALKHGKTERGAVAAVATANGLTVIQPRSVKLAVDELKAFGADIGVTAAYGQILNQAVLDVFKSGILNVHASLLPKYRGASPIQSAIAAGERTTGVTIMRTELGIDTGDIFGMVETDIHGDETSGELTARLAQLGAELLVKTLDDYDSITPTPQDHTRATHCRMIKKCDEYIDFDKPSTEVVNAVRALSPLPCAKTVINGEIYKIYRVRASDTDNACGAAGEIIRSDKALTIACASGAVDVLTIQAPSKRALDISDFLRGRQFKTGVVCEKP